MADHTPHKSRLLKGGLWAVAGRWSVKFLGLFSTLFVVRLLMPQDFGIIMKLTLVIAPASILVSIGFSETIIVTKNLTKKHYDTAFTLNIIVAACAAFLLNITAPMMALLFNEPLLKTLIPIFSIKILLLGLVNPKRLDFQRNFEYVKDFKFSVYHKLIHILSIVGCCFYFRNYYGLVYGQIGGAFAMVCVSYLMIGYRPSLSLKHSKAFIDFSVPNLSAGVGEYILMNLDRFLLVRFLNNTILGFYNLAYELAEQFTTEIIYPLAKGFFPAFSEIAQDNKQLKNSYLNCISFLIPLCLGVGVGLSMVAEPLIALYAGTKWMPSATLLNLLALSAAAQAFSLVSATILGATGKIKTRAMLVSSQAIISAIAMLPFVFEKNIQAVLIVKCIVSIIFVFINIASVCRYLSINLLDIAQHFIRPFFSAFIIYITLSYIDINHIILDLIAMVLMGVLSFVITHFSLWIIMGKLILNKFTTTQRIDSFTHKNNSIKKLSYHRLICQGHRQSD